MKFVALVALAVIASANASTSVKWGSAHRGSSIVTGVAGGHLVVTFTPTTTVPATGTVKITASAALFSADAVTTCTATSGGGQTVTAATVGNVLTVTLAATKTFDAAGITVITCTDNLAVNTAAGAVMFTIESSTDTAALTSQTGYTIQATAKAVWGSAFRGTSLVALAAGPGNLIVTFTPATTVTAQTVTITPSVNIFAADAAVTCTATSAGATPTATAASVGAILTVTFAGGQTLAAGAVAVITCTNSGVVFAANPAAGAVTFSLVTQTDAGANTGKTGYTVQATAKAVWGSAARTSLQNKVAGGDLVVTFTPTTTVPHSGTITITPSTAAAFFTAVADTATTCTATSGGVAKTVSGSVAAALGVLTVTLGGAGNTLAAGKVAVITCTTNLANNGAHGAVTFSLVTSTDATANTAQTGYTITGPSAVWGSAARSSFLGIAQKGGDLIVKFTPTTEVAAAGTITITPSTAAAFFTAVADTATACTAKVGTTAKVVTSAVAAAGGVLTVTMTPVLAAGAEVTITCTDNLAVNQAAAGAVTFSLVTSTDTVAITAQTGYAVTAGTQVAWGSAARTKFLGVGQAGGHLVVTFTPTTTVAAETVVTITPDKALFLTDAVTTCTATSGGTAQTVTAATVGNVLTVTLAATKSLTLAKVAVITCTDNLAVNTAADDVVAFKLKTTSDAGELLAQTGYTITAKQVAWGSAARTSVVAAADGGNLVVTFTPTTTVPAEGTVTITSSAALFKADAVTTCTATSDTTAQTVTAATVGNVLTVTLAALKTLTLAKVAVITCTDNLAVNTAAGAVTFKLKTSTDAGELLAQTGYAITAGTKAGTGAGTASGDDKVVITIKQVATLGIAAADYTTGLTKQFSERSMGIQLGICSTKCTSYTTGHTMTSAASRRASCTVTFTVVVPDADASTKVLKAGKAITKDTLTAAMVALKAADTATYAAFTAPDVKTVVAPTGGVVAAASTTTVGIFSALCLAVAALRQ